MTPAQKIFSIPGKLAIYHRQVNRQTAHG